MSESTRADPPDEPTEDADAGAKAGGAPSPVPELGTEERPKGVVLISLAEATPEPTHAAGETT